MEKNKSNKILLHICCAPCATYIIDDLKKNEFEITGYYYNPNIHPEEELALRKKYTEILAEQKGLKLVVSDDDKYMRWKEYQGTKENRCQMCYDMRLEEVAQLAAKEGYDSFSTSLMISPYQNHEMIVAIGNKYAQKYGVPFHDTDYRPYFREGQKIAREAQYYMQKYCGCVYSYFDSDYKKKPAYTFIN